MRSALGTAAICIGLLATQLDPPSGGGQSLLAARFAEQNSSPEPPPPRTNSIPKPPPPRTNSVQKPPSLPTTDAPVALDADRLHESNDKIPIPTPQRGERIELDSHRGPAQGVSDPLTQVVRVKRDSLWATGTLLRNCRLITSLHALIAMKTGGGRERLQRTAMESLVGERFDFETAPVLALGNVRASGHFVVIAHGELWGHPSSGEDWAIGYDEECLSDRLNLGFVTILNDLRERHLRGREFFTAGYSAVAVDGRPGSEFPLYVDSSCRVTDTLSENLVEEPPVSVATDCSVGPGGAGQLLLHTGADRDGPRLDGRGHARLYAYGLMHSVGRDQPEDASVPNFRRQPSFTPFAKSFAERLRLHLSGPLSQQAVRAPASSRTSATSQGRIQLDQWSVGPSGSANPLTEIVQIKGVGGAGTGSFLSGCRVLTSLSLLLSIKHGTQTLAIGRVEDLRGEVFTFQARRLVGTRPQTVTGRLFVLGHGRLNAYEEADRDWAVGYDEDCLSEKFNLGVVELAATEDVSAMKPGRSFTAGHSQIPAASDAKGLFHLYIDSQCGVAYWLPVNYPRNNYWMSDCSVGDGGGGQLLLQVVQAGGKTVRGAHGRPQLVGRAMFRLIADSRQHPELQVPNVRPRGVAPFTDEVYKRIQQLVVNQPIPDVNLTTLTPEARASVISTLSKEPCPCGRDMTLLQCRVKESCDLSRTLARDIITKALESSK